MKHLIFLLALLVGLIQNLAAQDSKTLLADAYKTEFENEYVKVQRVHYAPHIKLPEHDHPAFATAYVYLNDAGPVVYKHIGVSYGAVTRPPVKAGGFRLYKGVKETHEVESLSDVTSDFLRIEFKTDVGKDVNGFRGKYFREDVSAGENYQKIQFENDQVRITRLVCAAGKSCLEVANAKEPILFVVLTPAQFRIAKVPSLMLRPGDTHWIAAGKSVAGDNIGTTSAELLRFDFKTSPVAHPHSEVIHVHPSIAETVDPTKKAEAIELLKRGVALEREGKLTNSITTQEQALEINPGLVQAHINLISLYGRTRAFVKAEQHYRAALEINPDLPDIHYNFGVLLVTQERVSDAAAAFRQCLQLNPYYAEAHNNYAALIEREGKFDEAAAHYRKAIANKSDYRSAHFSLGRILVNQNKLVEAIAEFRQTLTPEDEETPRNYYALGATYIRAGDKTNGILYLREALKRASALHQTQLVSSLERDLKSLEP